MNKGFLDGETFFDRLQRLLGRPHRLPQLIPEVAARINQFLAGAVAVVRERFGGKVTYAAIHLERVDWACFDIVSMDLYRSSEIADRFTEGVRALVALGKPVAITEFGAATYRGAGERGAHGLEIVEHDKDTGAPLRLDGGGYLRDEEGQATYLRELLEIFQAEGVDSAFVFTFALHDYPHRPDGDPRPGGPPRRDLSRHDLGAQGRLPAAGPSVVHVMLPAWSPSRQSGGMFSLRWNRLPGS